MQRTMPTAAWATRVGLVALALATAGCSGDDDKGSPSDGTPVDSTTTTDTESPTVDTSTPTDSEPTPTAHTATDTGHTGTPGGTLSASCVLAKDNTLRAWCDVTTDPPAAVEVSFVPTAGGTERVHSSDAAAADHRVGLYLMTAETDYSWTARRVDDGSIAATGTFTTGALPQGAQLRYDATGSPAAEHYVHVSPCSVANMAIVTRATDDQVVWYQQFIDGDKFVGLELTEDGTILGMSGNDYITEVDFMGQQLLYLEQYTDFTGQLHHDLTRDDGRTFALFKERVNIKGFDFDLDGFFVFDEQGALAGQWHLADHWLPSGPHPTHGADVTHSNSIWVDDGVAIISIRHLSTVIAVAADPDAKNFGEVLWRLEGNPNTADWESDYQLMQDGTRGTFQEQHHAVILPNGRLSMFDNRISMSANSRAIEVELDDKTGVATIVQQYELPTHCNFQGGSNRTASGHAVITCAPRGLVYEFEPGTATVSWQNKIECDSGNSGVVPRLMPLE